MKKTTVLCLIVIFLTGCIGQSKSSETKSSETKLITLDIGGIPSRDNEDTFYGVVAAVNGLDEITVLWEQDQIQTSDKFTFNSIISSDTEYIAGYLFESNESQIPMYIWIQPVSSDSSNYIFYYWYQYIGHRDAIKFGLSDSFALDYEDVKDSGLYLNFDLAPYYLVRLPDNNSMLVECLLESYQGLVNMTYAESITKSVGISYPVELGSRKVTIENYGDAPSYLVFLPGDYQQSTQGSVRFKHHSKVDLNYLWKVIPSKNADLVFGLNLYEHMLYYINPLIYELEEIYSLPTSTQYAAAFYCSNNNALYFSDYSGNLMEIWDVATAELTMVEFETNFNLAVDQILVAPQLKRIYILGLGGLHIVDMDSHELLATHRVYSQSNGKARMEVDEVHEKLYIIPGTDPSRLFRYSVINDQLVTEEILTVDSGFFGLSEGKDRITVYSSGRLQTIAALNFKKIFHSVRFDSVPMGMSNDGEYVYGIYNDGRNVYDKEIEQIYILDKYNINKGIWMPKPMTFYSGEIILTSDNKQVIFWDGDSVYFLNTFLDQSEVTAKIYQELYRQSLFETLSLEITAIMEDDR